jgi:hypothetical protein
MSVAEQRYEAVRAVIADGETVTDVAARFGVARKTMHVWLAKYEAGGLEGLADGSHRPRSCPHQMPTPVEVALTELRLAHPPGEHPPVVGQDSPVVGGFALADGTRAKALTGVDDHSRFCVSARLMSSESSRGSICHNSIGSPRSQRFHLRCRGRRAAGSIRFSRTSAR